MHAFQKARPAHIVCDAGRCGCYFATVCDHLTRDIQTADNSQRDVRWFSLLPALPPLYREFHDAEIKLPQHHYKDPFHGIKYISVASHVVGIAFYSCPPLLLCLSDILQA